MLVRRLQLLSVFIAGLLFGASLLLAAEEVLSRRSSDQELVADFYRTENAVSVSPHGLRGKMDKGDQSFVLVDLRSQEEYLAEHIVGAVNIPAYKDKYTPAYGDVERIVSGFRDLKEKYPDRDIIVYCYSKACMTGRKVGLMLAEHGVYVKHLNIGWYEWRHDWNSWNHEHEWTTDTVSDYVWSGQEPGEVKANAVPNPCVEGSLGC